MAIMKPWLLIVLASCSMQSPINTAAAVEDAGVIRVPGVKTFYSPVNTTANMKVMRAMPRVKLPYGTYEATYYDSDRDVYTFKNIRFGKAPVGDLRFNRPESPAANASAGLQKDPGNTQCIAYFPRRGLNMAGEYSDNTAFSGPLNWIIPKVGGPLLLDGGTEDCLFLDVQVPGKLIREPGSKKVPVVNWIYGGAFYLGSKETGGIYSGAHLIDMAGGDMIFVLANYRLGLYGWLAGPTVEEQATANAGLHDQRLALQWIQDHIHLFGGDKEQVSAWGESAGASSILHHLVAYGGKQDPLFKRAVLMSPAFQSIVDRRPTGQQEGQMNKLLGLAKCADMACLRKLPNADLIKLNWQIQDEVPRGTIALGPSVDGSWSRRVPGVELKEANVWKGLESVIVTHTTHESTIFVDGTIQTDEQFNAFLAQVFGELGTNLHFVQEVNDLYPRSAYETQSARMRSFIQDYLFNCNVRWLTNALPTTTKTYNMVYGEGAAWHALDVISMFYRADMRVGNYSVSLAPAMTAFTKAYQSYFVSHALTGDPNKMVLALPNGEAAPTTSWPSPPTFDGENIGNVLFVGNDTFKLGLDTYLPKTRCDYMQNFHEKVAEVVEQTAKAADGRPR